METMSLRTVLAASGEEVRQILSSQSPKKASPSKNRDCNLEHMP